MKKNVGVCDKVIRVVLAIIIGLLYYFGVISGTWGIVLLVLAIVFLFTGLLNFCGLYSLFGINTCKKKEDK
ncbi:MAG: DUF2892 domain-containing protein [Bacteroidota bacterium]